MTMFDDRMLAASPGSLYLRQFLRRAVRELREAAEERAAGDGLTVADALVILGPACSEAGALDLLALACDVGKLIEVRAHEAVDGEWKVERRWMAWDGGRKIGGGA